jgi:membrane-associated protein
VLLAATGWAAYQAAVGALFAAILPGGQVVVIAVSVAVAIGVGSLIDLLIRRRSRRRTAFPSRAQQD